MLGSLTVMWDVWLSFVCIDRGHSLASHKMLISQRKIMMNTVRKHVLCALRHGRFYVLIQDVRSVLPKLILRNHVRQLEASLNPGSSSDSTGKQFDPRWTTTMHHYGGIKQVSKSNWTRNPPPASPLPCKVFLTPLIFYNLSPSSCMDDFQ